MKRPILVQETLKEAKQRKEKARKEKEAEAKGEGKDEEVRGGVR